MVPSPLSCHFLGSPLRKTALLTEGCQKNTAKLLRPSAVNRSHCWAEGHAKTTPSWSPKGATAATAVTLWLRWKHWSEVFALVRWLIRSIQIWNHGSTYSFVHHTCPEYPLNIPESFVFKLLTVYTFSILRHDSAWCNVCQQQDAVQQFSFASWQEILHASVEPWVVVLEGL